MKKSLIVYFALGMSSTVLVALDHHKKIDLRGWGDLLFGLIFSSFVTLLLHCILSLKTLEVSLFKKTKELLFLKAKTNTAGLDYAKGYLEDLKTETSNYGEISNLKNTIVTSLVERYSSSRNLKEFCDKVSYDNLFTKDNSELSGIFSAAVRHILVLDTFKKLFAEDLKDIISSNSPEKAKIIWGWSHSELSLFKPFESFTEELVEIKKVIPKVA